MKLSLCIKFAFLIVTLGTDCLGLDDNICKDLTEKRKCYPVIKVESTIIESIMVVQQYGNTPTEYSAAVGIINFYNRACNPVLGVISDQALNAKDSETKFNKDFVKYDSFIREQEKNDLKEISKICANIGFDKITNNAALAIFLFNQYHDLSKAVNTYFKDFLLNSKIEVLKPSAKIVTSCLDNEVPFILLVQNDMYLCFGYFEQKNDFYLVVAELKEIAPYRHSVRLDRLERMKKRKDNKKKIKIIEGKIKIKGANYLYLDYTFKLKTASDKTYIKTIKWMPSPDQRMTIIYPPKCDKKALLKCLE